MYLLLSLTDLHRGKKPQICFLAQDCAFQLMKQAVEDSEIVKKKNLGAQKLLLFLMMLYIFPLQSCLLNYIKNCTDASNKGNNKLFPVPVQYFTP
jgi:hypothetical protein